MLRKVLVVLPNSEYLQRAFEPLRISASYCRTVDALDGRLNLTGIVFRKYWRKALI